VGAIAAAAVVALILALAGRSLVSRLLAVLAQTDDLGPAAPIVFALIYAAAVVALVPSTPLSLAAGALFGIVQGVIVAFVGATLGSTVAFLLGRHAARPFVEHLLVERPRLAAVDRAVTARGRRIVFLLRLSPVVPFSLLNYALGLTTISVWDFMVACSGSIPGDIMYVYWGRVSGEALAIAGEAVTPKSASYYAFLLAGLAATLLATALVTRTARRALRDV